MTVKFCFAGTVLSSAKPQESSSFPSLLAGASTLRVITCLLPAGVVSIKWSPSIKNCDFTATPDGAVNEGAKP